MGQSHGECKRACRNVYIYSRLCKAETIILRRVERVVDDCLCISNKDIGRGIDPYMSRQHD